MTMPHLMNCGHSDEGWCLDCVQAQHAALTAAETDRQKAEAELLRCRTTEAVAAHQLDNLRVELGIGIEHAAPVDAAREIRAKVAELRELRAKLPQTADGVAWSIGTEVWRPEYQQPATVEAWGVGVVRCRFYHPSKSGLTNTWTDYRPASCYSTPEAAAQSLARGERGEGQ